ncbi:MULTISPECIES: DUF4255 domain-containing protein [Hwangdonia]|uniref:DUF4255 domain-containing protein n=1 Tax=Hwangdonia seohaensis TaxID=1240727 RepID=A0ABW3RFB8_9FLAO|nr:DUF4255 domain-containing protein [Hwangdonia seohaensis]
MIFEVLQIITEDVNNFFGDSPVSLDNIASVASEQGDNTGASSDIILSLLNLQEEATLKNKPNYAVEGTRISYKNNIVNLNLYVLFSATNDKYDEALKNLSKIIEFFQGKKVFTQGNTVYNRDDVSMSKITNFRFVVDLFTPTFEELNFVWGTLGGKQIPSVMYKVSLVEIEREAILGKGGLISQVNGDLTHKN